jgi:carboxyl-terminal processing protease
MTLNDSDLLDANVQEKYRSLLAEIKTKKITGLDQSKKEIIKQLEDEIVTRYFYNEGLFEYYLTHDEAILTATELLENAGKYKSILK